MEILMCKDGETVQHSLDLLIQVILAYSGGTMEGTNWIQRELSTAKSTIPSIFNGVHDDEEGSSAKGAQN